MDAQKPAPLSVGVRPYVAVSAAALPVPCQVRGFLIDLLSIIGLKPILYIRLKVLLNQRKAFSPNIQGLKVHIIVLALLHQ